VSASETPAEPTVVILPDDLGDLAVCDWEALIEGLSEGGALDDAIVNATIDTLTVRSATNVDDLRGWVARVRQLNQTGDAGAYWG